MNMNKLKFTNHNALGKPQNVILKYANGDTEVLDAWPHTMYYDKADKQYRTFPAFTKINNETYV
jgi:hypothetical protein|tara:strand:- start:220 stop:411 length:192 start_codon:yes stop_codon:yes gene_type:complete